ncbi:shikimate dehydrogenase family protein [Salegentibacter sediminis]|uniref:shikimate dehydrogenase family protein n=1 Tax=Salegentibacter sediminis TaxID=1930251 RepID=UPI0009C0C30F|nr:shikimate dehydrogenase [Salegentibacter sediminis]
MKTYGLVGKDIDYSFSRAYFADKFKRENIAAEYKNFDLEEINQFPIILQKESQISGLNVTIPYKQAIIPYLDKLSVDAENIGAVNTIKVEKDYTLTGHNTDFIGFQQSIKPFLKAHHKKALILGTGGASKAIAYALEDLGIDFRFVSRKADFGRLDYASINKEILQEFSIIVNCTPLGTFPAVEKHPPLAFKHINSSHLVYDLIYNPESTKLMDLALQQGATVSNGLKMLELQAEAAWNIWTS